jgi:anti-sigma regulatory factor (Ser/Thr protein kinase)
MQLTAAREPAVTYLPGRDPAHARHARNQARALLEAWELGEHADLGELIVSELVTNAVCHGEGPIWMQLSFARGDLRVEVHDDGAGRPVRKHVGGDDECGRGLELLDGLIELHGGERGVINDQARPGKTVYVVLSLEATPVGAR